MRTREVRKLEKQGLRRARMHGHDPMLVSESGALRLFACAGDDCSALLESWDMPAVVTGAMLHAGCGDRLTKHWLLRMRRKIWILIQEGRWI